MAHNHIVSNQQQHSMMNSVPTTSSGQQRSMMTQRVGQAVAPPKSLYHLQSSQLSHLQQTQQNQSQIMSGFQTQSSSDMATHQFSTNLGHAPAQNGNAYPAVGGSSHASSLGLDNGQLGLQPSHQYQQQQQQTMQLHSQQPFQSRSAPHLQQSQQQQHSTLQHPSQQFLQQQHAPTQSPTHSPQSPQSQTGQQDLHQQQPPRYHAPAQAQQPKHILQHSSPATRSPVSAAPTQESSSLSVLHFDSGKSSHAGATNGQLGLGQTAKTKEEKRENEELNVAIENEETKENASNASGQLSVANTKEKTPMCLINELARYNKTEHQYTLVDEQGPAHKKTFYVKLKLGDEEYSANGESIKKAQHAAAAVALEETKFKHPPPKLVRSKEEDLVDGDGNITPTVELNALAMKRGETAVYKAIEPQQPPYYHHGMDYRGYNVPRYYQNVRGNRDPRCRGFCPLRYHYPRMSRAFYVSLRVGHREFIGDGTTRQAARHNAAQKALRILKNLPVQEESKQTQEDDDDEDSLKSEISLVHEVALRRNMAVTFQVIREVGPAHMKTFITHCLVSDKVTEGEGNSKKLSKKRAAQLMLEELKKLPPLPAMTYVTPKSKMQMNKKKNRNLIKSEIQQQKADPNYGVGINPISRLIQIMQAQKKKEPVYTLVAERGLPRRREFIMKVEVEDKMCTGTGPNKKLAKRSAAEAMLQVLGYTKPSPQPAKSSFKTAHSSEGNQNGDKKVTFFDNVAQEGEEEESPNSATPPATQQRVPGLLHLPSSKSMSLATASSTINTLPAQNSTHKEPLVNLSEILKPSLRPETQLRELCKVLNQHMEIDDFTKKRQSGTEHIARISLGEENPQNFHGCGNTLEGSRDMAALDALKVLVQRVKSVHPGGDGPQVKKTLLTRSASGSRKDLPK